MTEKKLEHHLNNELILGRGTIGIVMISINSYKCINIRDKKLAYIRTKEINIFHHKYTHELKTAV